MIQEKDTEYNALVKKLKDRIINLEQELQDTQHKAGFPIGLPYDTASLRLTPQMSRRQPPKPLFQKLDSGRQLSDTEMSDLSPDGEGDDDDDDKTATVERKVPAAVKDELDSVVPPHALLDSSANRSKCDLVSRGGLAKRQLPSGKKSLSNSSSDCALNDSGDDDQVLSSHQNGHFNGGANNNNNSNNILLRQRAAVAAASATVDHTPPLYAQVHKDRDSTRMAADSVVVTAASANHYAAPQQHSTIPNIFKGTATTMGDVVGIAASGSFNNDLTDSYDSIIGSTDKLSSSENGQNNSDNWMYPSRRRSPKNPPNSFTEQLNQVLSEREK